MALRLLDRGRHLFDDFIVLGEAADVVLVPDLRAVDVDVEHAAGSFDHFRGDVEAFLDRVRQTGGCREVVSLHAVFDADVHRRLVSLRPMSGR